MIRVAFGSVPKDSGTFTFYRNMRPALLAQGIDLRCVAAGRDQASLTEHQRNHRRQRGRGIRTDRAATVGQGVTRICSGLPAIGTAEIGKGILGHEEQRMGILLRADLEPKGRRGRRVIIDRDIVDPQRSTPVSATEEKSGLGHEWHVQNAGRLAHEVDGSRVP